MLLFGLKEKDVKLRSISRESPVSRYIKYIKKVDEVVQNLERGLLLDVDYDGGQNKAYCKFYDLDNDNIKIWIDTSGHEPYCLSKESISELKKLSYGKKQGREKKLENYDGLKRFEEVKRVDLLRDKKISMTKIYGKNPLNVGGKGTNIKTILGENQKDVWEADIRYYMSYIFDRQLIPGLIYSISDGVLEKVEFKEGSEESKKLVSELRNLFKHDAREMREFAEKYLDIFTTPIPKVKMLALDIEIYVDENSHGIPDPNLSPEKIISISFVSTDGLKLVYILKREGFSSYKRHRMFPEDGKVVFFDSEKKLLIETFRLIWEYPILITFNGNNFDLNYVFHRAKKLRIDSDLNPIYVKRGFGIMASVECELRKGIHIDLFNFFFNRSIAGNAFAGYYENASLDAISNGLLGENKYEHEENIGEMDYGTLAWYNLKDSLLTLELTMFNNSLVWNLIILLCRITKTPMHEMIRRQVSSWIKNLVFFEHRRKGYLIPRKNEISSIKKGGKLMSVAGGGRYQGAYVIEPVSGIHFNVVVMDFSSLYPTIVKEYNLSYETVLCSHKEDENNIVDGTPYYICSKKMGILSYIIGFLRDIRVKYFKPKSIDSNLTESQRSYYNIFQQALKVFINASYGILGSNKFPLFCLPVAESITGIGRNSIKRTIEKSEELGIKVLYGDTDSIFLLNPAKEHLKTLSDWSRKELDLDLEEEKTYQFLALSYRKKNYIGIYKGSKKVDIKGLVVKKSHTPNFIKQIFNEIKEILKEITNDVEFKIARKKIISIIKENLKKIGKADGFSLDDYVINMNLGKNIDKYIKTIPQHVRAVKNYLTQKVSEARTNNASDHEINSIKNSYKSGDTVRFIKSKDNTGAKIIDHAQLQDIDIKKYNELLESALEQILDPLGITFNEIRGISKIDNFF